MSVKSLFPVLGVLCGLLQGFLLLIIVWGGQAVSGAEKVAFVDDGLCQSCHADIFAAWQTTHHARAMQPATTANVLGDFSNARFADRSGTTRFLTRNGQFFIHTQGSDGRMADFRVKYTFGIHPLQQYLVELPRGRLQAFTVAWDSVQHRWFSLYPEQKISPGDPLHWTNRRFTWNSSCAECHSTDLRLGHEAKNQSYQTSWAAISVGCQACHGPGQAHMTWASNPTSEAPPHKGFSPDVRGIETCAACHARRYPISPDDRHERPLLDHFMPELLREGLYHADGQMQDEVFNYGSFLQSKMYQKGVVCNDCHDPHTLKTRQPGNALCTGCHRNDPPHQRFSSLTSRSYDDPAHHFHPPGSRGAECINCHAPAQTYMVVDPRHDHGFRIPRPDLSIRLGVPNACVQCHTDKDNSWALQQMTRWYGSGWQKPHYGEILAEGRKGTPAAIKGLAELAGNNSQPAIVRATALDLLRGYGASYHAVMFAQQSDPDPLVRTLAVQGLEHPATDVLRDAVVKRLHDPVRSVRLEAARVLAISFPALLTQQDHFLSSADRIAFKEALQDYETAQTVVSDQPDGYANLGVFHAATGRTGAAEQDYLTAIQRDSGFYQAYNNLAQLYAGSQRPAEAEKILRKGLQKTPDAGVLHYSLGLLLAGQQRTGEALKALQQAARQMPAESRIYYNLGLLLQSNRQYAEAETALRKALELQAENPDYLYALVIFYQARQQPQLAKTYIQRLQTLYPEVSQFRTLTRE